MSLINFSDFKNIKTHKILNKLTITFFISITLISIVTISYFQLKQLNIYLKLRDDFYHLDKYVQNQKYIFDKKIKLNKSIKLLESKQNMLISKVYKIKDILKFIMQHIPVNIAIDNFLYTTNKLNIKGQSKSWISLGIFANKLSNKLGKLLKHKTSIKTSEDITLILYELEFELS